MRETVHNPIIAREAQALNSLNASLENLLDDTMTADELLNIVENGLFTPAQDEKIAYWFAQFLTLRTTFWSIVDTTLDNISYMKQYADVIDWQYFVLSYSAICSLVRMDRFLLNNVAIDSIIQRKLNEPFPQHRIERKQYSQIYSQLVLPSNAIRIHQAHRLLGKFRPAIGDSTIGTPTQSIFSNLPKQESYLNFSKRCYLTALFKSRLHAWRRRGASAKQKSLFTMLEYGGRAASELKLPRTKKVTPATISRLKALLLPGDIIITRHRQALTNLFLPGFWPHAALYVGTEKQRDDMAININPIHIKHWIGENCTFEALKDGVHFRPLEETLSVDAFVVIRPNLLSKEIAKAISRVVVHAGKNYNFDFDFFRSDQLVCTEVIYRAYDGINGFNIPLQERAGRKTLSAEDLLDLSVNTKWAEPLAIFGVGRNKSELVTEAKVKQLLIESYRQDL